MPKSDYVAPNDLAYSAQMQTFKNNIGGYSAVLGLVAAQITGQAADADYLAHVLACQSIMQDGSQQWTSWKNIMRDGGNPPPTGAPVAPAFPAPAPAAVAPGIEARFRALAKLIKANPAYNVAMGQALGIEGTQTSGPDLTTVQPNITATISGNHVFVDWRWQGNASYLDMCEIQVDRGDGKGFVLLAYDTTPGYNDTQPFPATPAKWTYRAIYRVDDAQVGQWSNPVTITVGT